MKLGPPPTPAPIAPPPKSPKRRRLVIVLGLVPVVLAFSLAALALAQPSKAAPTPRKYNSADIKMAEGYQIEPVITNLTAPTTALFDGTDLIVAESGGSTLPPRVVRIKPDGNTTVLASTGLHGLVTGLAIKDGRLYISHKGKVSVVEPGGKLVDIVSELPSLGEHQNNNLALGPDGKLYLGQGTVTNAGVVGPESYARGWLAKYPELHEVPCRDVTLLGQNYRTENPFTPASEALTGGYEQFGAPSLPDEIVKGDVKCGGSILRFNVDGSDLQVAAWGFRNPFGIKFDRSGQLWATDQGVSTEGIRQIGNAPDYLVHVDEGAWYGWPDFFNGQPVTDDQFIIAGKPQSGFLWDQHPPLSKAFITFPSQSTVGGLAFSETGTVAFVAMLGPLTSASSGAPGFRIARVDLQSRHADDLAVNVVPGPAYGTQRAGLDRPSDLVFGPDGGLYVVDLGETESTAQGPRFVPQTGAIWRIYPANGRALRPEGPLAIQPGSSREGSSEPQAENTWASDLMVGITYLPVFVLILAGLVLVVYAGAAAWSHIRAR